METLTRGGDRRRIWLLAAVLGLVATSVIVLPTTSSRAQQTGVEIAAGVLLLQIDSNGPSGVQYYPDADETTGVLGSPADSQPIAVSSKCAVGTDHSLLSISETGGTRGLGVVSNGLGVRTKNNCSTAQGRIDTAQSVSLSLGSSIPDNTYLKSVEVDIEGKFGADLVYSLDGGSPVTVNLPNTSDNGPDSGAGDNNRVSIDPGQAYSSITFGPSLGEVAIESGGDGQIARGPLQTIYGVDQTLIELVAVYDGEIACGGNASTGNGIDDPKATFIRGDDDQTKGGECDELIGYNLSSSDDGTQQVIGFEYQEEEVPSWFGTFIWTPEPAVVPVPATELDEDGDGVYEANLEWCDGFSGIIDPEAQLEIPVLPAGSNWCLVNQSTELQPGGLMQVTQEVYGITDPFWARP